MSDQVVTSLKANRIVAAQAGIQAAEKELAEANKRLDAAIAALKTATGAETADAEAAKQAAADEVAAAETKLKYERDELQRLLGCGKWYHAIPWGSSIPFIFFGVLGGIVLKAILDGLNNPALLKTLENIPSSRGLITLLVTLVTVTIALILSLSTIVSNSPDRAERFKDGKDLLFALIGVLGTIIGFYFGQMESGDVELQVAPVVVTNQSPSVGDKFNVISFATGGAAPYTFEIVFDPKVREPITVESDAGVLNQEIDTAEFTDQSEQEIAITINVSDGQGATKSSDAITVKLSAKP